MWERDDIKQWQALPFTASGQDRLAWQEEMIQEGESWIQAQSAYKDIDKGVQVLSGSYNNPFVAEPDYRSHIRTQRLKRDVREIVGTLANIRMSWGYGSDASFYRASSFMMNTVSKAVYLESFFDRKLKGALQYMAATGTGYVWPKYRRPMYGYAPGRIDFDFMGALDVLPVQMPADNDLQEAYIVTLDQIVPVAKAHGMFPQFQNQLHPLSKRKYRGSVANKRVSLAERFRGHGLKNRADFANLYCDFRYTYILDTTLNTTGSMLPMGQLGSSWYYEVPYVGMEIATRDPLTGELHRRKAYEEDCRIYPRRRLMISTKDVLVYDGPAFDWHSMVPVFPICADRWAWEGLGCSLTSDGYEYQEAINELERFCNTVARARLRPGLTYDIGSGGEINSLTAEGLDPFKPDVRVGIDSSGASDKPPFMPIIPEGFYEVPSWFFPLMERYEQGMDFQLGLKEITALAKLRANADASTLDKILEVMGPIVSDISRDMEMAMRDSGNMMKYMILQYMTTQRIMQYTGEDGITPETYDYDPETLIPSHMPFEAKAAMAGEKSSVSQLERARHFADNLRFTITPNSLHEITQMTRKLSLLQLKKAGLWIDDETIATAFDVPNFGTIEGVTVIEKFWNQKGLELAHAANLKAVAEGLGGGGSGTGGGGNPVGRPNTDAASPQLKQKGMASGGRTTVTTSK